MALGVLSGRRWFAALAAAWLGLACTAQELQEGDRDLVLKIGQLEAYGLELPANFAEFESVKREKWFDGSVMIEYEFEAPATLGLPYLYSIAEQHPSQGDACLSHAAGSFGARIGGAEINERVEDFDYGDRSRFAVLVDGGQPYGNFFSMCKGKTAFMVMLGGFYFDDAQTWGELLASNLQAIDARQ